MSFDGVSLLDQPTCLILLQRLREGGDRLGRHAQAEIIRFNNGSTTNFLEGMHYLSTA